MKSKLKYVFLGLLCYLTFLVMQFPASNAYALVKSTLSAQNVPLKLYGLQGSVWKGSASTLIYDGHRFDTAVWEFYPLDLLTAKVTLSVRLKGKDIAFKGKLSQSLFGELFLENVHANVGAAKLLALLKIPAVKLGGKLSLNVVAAEIQGSMPSYIQGRLLWTDATSTFPQKLSLGDMFADLTTDDNGDIKALLGDGGGPLELSGGLTLTPVGQYEAKGLFSSREGRNSVLGRSLGFVGRYDSAGKIAFNRSGNLSEFEFLVK